MATITELEERIKKIEQRNERVEADKAWETSYVRKALLILFTYFAVGFYLQAIQVPNPWLGAIIPSLGFLLSTLTLPFFKELWSKYVCGKKTRTPKIGDSV